VHSVNSVIQKLLEKPNKMRKSVTVGDFCEWYGAEGGDYT